MTDCTPRLFEFPACKRRKVEAEFSGGDVTSDGGILLLRQVDRRLGLSSRIALSLKDSRDPNKLTHSTIDLVRQRLFGLALGYEDLNDHQMLRYDPGFQTGVDREQVLAGSSTLCRFENAMDREIFWSLHNIMVDQFIASHATPPEELILDFDATDDPVHGKQEYRFFHGYYDSYCFLPLYVFCGDQPLVSYLRPSNIDAMKHSGAMLKWLVRRLRDVWPQVRIIFRGDSGFCRHWLLGWCERNDVGYIVGIARNVRLQRLSCDVIGQAAQEFKLTGEKQRLFGELNYAASSWKRERRIIIRAEHSEKGENPRFVVTNLEGKAGILYDRIYCARGEMENRIKEQLQLFADRTSCHNWWPNQFRLLLSTFAYMLLEAIRRLGLAGTEMAHAQCTTIRLRLLKIGAIVLRNTRRVRFLLSSACPYQDLFAKVYLRISTG